MVEPNSLCHGPYDPSASMHVFSFILGVQPGPPRLRLLSESSREVTPRPSSDSTGRGCLNQGAREPNAFESPSDEELVRRAAGGDREASGELISRHITPVLKRAQRLLGRSAEAEDVVQDAFYEALRDLAKLKEPARFGAWVGSIAVHQVHRRFRRRRLQLSLGLLAPGQDRVLSELSSSHSDPSVRAQLAQIDEILMRQAPRDRLAWMLRHVEGLSLKDVAEQTGCSLATSKRQISRVQLLIDQQLGPAFPDPDR